MKTSDRGVTWQTYELPMVGRISFSSPSDGWLTASAPGQIYHTMDGGLTWQANKFQAYPLSQVSYPDGTTLSGWQTGTLGWALTSAGACNGDKSSPGFTCQVHSNLLQTVNGGLNWESIPIPASISAVP